MKNTKFFDIKKLRRSILISSQTQDQIENIDLVNADILCVIFSGLILKEIMKYDL